MKRIIDLSLEKIGLLYFILVLTLIFKAFILSQPYIFGDELSYKTMATAYHYYSNFYFFSSSEIGHATNIPNVLYQFVISFAFYFGDNFYTIIKIFNSLLVALFIVPIFFLLKEFKINESVIIFVLISLFFLPELNYVVNIMPENLYLPLYIIAFYASYLALIKQSKTFILLSALFIVLLYVTKPHAIAFILSFYVTILILTLLKYFKVKTIIFLTLLHILTVFLLYLVISYALGLDTNLGVYSKVVNDVNLDINWYKFFELIAAHIASILLIYGLPLLSIFYILMKRNNYSRELYILNILTLVSFLVLVAMVIKFTNDIASAENYTRLHARYYYMIFPVLVSVFVINLKYIKLSKFVWFITLLIFITLFFMIFRNEPFNWNPGYVSDNISLTWLILFHDKTILIILAIMISLALIYWNVKTYLLLYILFGSISSYAFFTSTKALHHSDALKANLKTSLAKPFLNKEQKDIMLIGPDHLSRMNTAFWYPGTFVRTITLDKSSVILPTLIPSNVNKLLLYEDYKIDDSIVYERFQNCNEDNCIYFLKIYKYKDLINNFGTYETKERKNGLKYLKRGWSRSEPNHVWTEGKMASLKLPLNDNLMSKDILIEFDITPLNNSQRAEFYINNQKLQNHEFVNSELYKLKINKTINNSRFLEIAINLPDAKSPKELGLNEDVRILSLALKSFKISSINGENNEK